MDKQDPIKRQSTNAQHSQQNLQNKQQLCVLDNKVTEKMNQQSLIKYDLSYSAYDPDNSQVGIFSTESQVVNGLSVEKPEDQERQKEIVVGNQIIGKNQQKTQLPSLSEQEKQIIDHDIRKTLIKTIQEPERNNNFEERSDTFLVSSAHKKKKTNKIVIKKITLTNSTTLPPIKETNTQKTQGNQIAVQSQTAKVSPEATKNLQSFQQHGQFYQKQIQQDKIKNQCQTPSPSRKQQHQTQQQKMINKSTNSNISQQFEKKMSQQNHLLPQILSLKIQDSKRQKIYPKQQNVNIYKIGKAVIFSKTAISGQIKIGFEEDKTSQQFRPTTIRKKQVYIENKQSYYYVFSFDFYTKQVQQIHFQLAYDISTGWFGGKSTHKMVATSQVYGHRCFVIFSIQQLQKHHLLNSCCLAYEALSDISATKNKQKSQQQQVLDKIDNAYIIESKLQGLKFETVQVQKMFMLKKIQSLDKLRYLMYMMSLHLQSPKDIIYRLQKREAYDTLFQKSYKRPSSFINGSHKALEDIFLRTVYQYLLEKNQQINKKMLIYKYLRANLTYQQKDVQKQIIVKTFKKASYLLEKQIQYCRKFQLITPKELFIIYLANFKYESHTDSIEHRKKIKIMLNSLLDKYKNWWDASTCEKTELKQFSGWMKHMNSRYASIYIENQLEECFTFYHDTEYILREFYNVNRQFYNNWRTKTDQGFMTFIKNLINYHPIHVFREYLMASDSDLINKYENSLEVNLQEITPNLLELVLKLILEMNKESNHLKSRFDFINKLIKKKIIQSKGKQISAYVLAQILTKYFPDQQKIELYNILMKLFRSSPWIKLKIQKTGLLKLDDNSLIFGELCFQLNQNTDIGEKLCQKFGIAMKSYLTKADDRTTFQAKLMNHLKKQINPNYKKAFNEALTGWLTNLQQAKEDFFNLLLSDEYNQLKQYQEYYTDYQEKIFSKIESQIMLKNITYQQLIKLNENEALLKNVCPSVYNAVKKNLNKVKTLISKIEKSIQVLIMYKTSEIQESVKYLEKCLQDIQNDAISNFQLKQQYKQLLQFCEEIAEYQTKKEWQQLQISNLSMLLQQRQNFKSAYVSGIENSMFQLLNQLKNFPSVIFDSLFKQNLSQQRQTGQVSDIYQIIPQQNSQQVQAKIFIMREIKNHLQNNIKHLQDLAERKVQLQSESLEYILGTK